MTRLHAEETELAEKLQSIYDFFQKEEFIRLRRKTSPFTAEI